MEILFITYDIVRRVAAHTIQKKYISIIDKHQHMHFFTFNTVVV